jgi:hypothetical protein
MIRGAEPIPAISRKMMGTMVKTHFYTAMFHKPGYVIFEKNTAVYRTFDGHRQNGPAGLSRIGSALQEALIFVFQW